MGELTCGSPGDPLAYYACHGPVTDPKDGADLLEGLPADISTLCRIVQGCLLHAFWAGSYGEKLSEDRKQEVELRHVAKMLARIREIDERPLTVPRPPGKRLVGNCRDFSVLLCSALREMGVPARARCGFARYFLPGRYEDHWVCECWRQNERRWALVDAQLDEVQREALHIQFDPCDVPRDEFLCGGDAWTLCRSGQADPNDFGIFDMRGLWFVRGDLVRDLASLNKMELLPWDSWGLIEGEDEGLSQEDMALLDRVAALTSGGDAAFREMRSTYEGDERLRVPAVITSYGSSGVQAVRLGEV